MGDTSPSPWAMLLNMIPFQTCRMQGRVGILSSKRLDQLAKTAAELLPLERQSMSIN